MTHGTPKAAILSLGSSYEPIAATLRDLRPEHVLLLISKESHEVLPALRAASDYWPLTVETVMTNDPENLETTARALAERLPEFVASRKLEPMDIAIDFTGGTKVMSAALVLVGARYSSCFRYVGGVRRNNSGMGTVITGYERPVHVTNPWTVLALEKHRHIERDFAGYRFESAVQTAKELSGYVPEQRTFYKTIENAALAYQEWDRFNHRRAADLLHRAIQGFAMYLSCPNHPQGEEVLRGMRDNLGFLEQLKSAGKGGSRQMLLDLVANADRRIEEARYDDAVARLYRVVEAQAQIALRADYQIDTSNVDTERLPPEAKEVLSGVEPNQSGKIPIGLQLAYRLLQALGHPLAERFLRLGFGDSKRSPLSQRNQSILAHGFQPISEEAVRTLRKAVGQLCEIDDSELPRFPKLVLYP